MSVVAESVFANEMALSEAAAMDRGGWTGSALLGSAAVLIWNDVTPEGRQEFYAWHDKEHIPERMALPGFRRGRRFACSGHSPEWLTMYEADNLRAFVSPEYLARLNAPTPATVSALRHFRNTSRAVCRLVRSVGSSTGGHVLAMRLNDTGEQADAMCRYLGEDAFPRAIARTGVVACHLYQADASASHVSTAESRTREFDVPGWVLLCEASNPGAAHGARDVIDDRELARLGVEVRPDAAVHALEICRLSTSVQRHA